jgi:hypothetical protein
VLDHRTLGDLVVVKGDLYAGAIMSQDLRHRLVLWRVWDPELPTWHFVQLNPSTADHEQSDPTLRKDCYFAKRGGAGGVRLVNAYSLRATSPTEMLRAADRVGPLNDRVLRQELRDAQRVVVAWGAQVELDRERELVDMILELQVHTWSFGKTGAGHPRHPLYLANTSELVPWP